MATVTYTLSGDSVTFAFTPTTPASAHTYQITYTSGTLTGSTSVAGAGEPGPYYTTITGLEGGQTYNFDWDWSYYDEGETIQVEQGSVSVVTPEDTPKTARMSQWEDLATRVKAKSDVVISMTTTDPGEGSALAADHYVGVYGGDPIIMDYSTSEINTGAKWIDGSAIYKKTINFGALPNATTKTVAHGISNLNYVIKLEGMTTSSTDSIFRPLPHLDTASLSNQVLIEADSTNIYLYTGVNYSNLSAYITIEYTKSS